MAQGTAWYQLNVAQGPPPLRSAQVSCTTKDQTQGSLYAKPNFYYLSHIIGSRNYFVVVAVDCF